MGAIVNFINVGWGDAHLIRLPSGAVTLIDGGDGSRSPERDHPLDWMDRNGVSALDWMILTHIHEDHLNGLMEIARHRTVKQAILPYELPPKLLQEPAAESRIRRSGSQMAVNVYGMLSAYAELIRLLQEQGTEILWRFALAGEEGSIVWAKDGFALTHLYPWPADPLPGLELLQEAAQSAVGDDADIMRAAAALEAFFAYSNDDSSVYRLSSLGDSSANLLFGGDQLAAGWKRLAGRTDLRSRVWKVPHHGLEDGFQAGLLSVIQPEICVIPICSERSLPFRERWEQLRAGSQTSIHMTGAVAPGASVRLTTGPIEAWIGG